MREGIRPALRQKLQDLPKDPGCYLLKDSLGRIMYVGKAKSLRLRLRHYFLPVGQLDHKTSLLSREIHDFEVMLTSTEVEALLLERTLIKHHKPRFNILLRDDKEYPYMRVDFQEPWPRLEKVRRRKDDGAVYLGPFGSAGQLKVLLDAVYRIFPLIRCSRHEFEHARRPCNYFHMKMCLAPCTRPVDQAQYKSMLKDATDIIAGRNREVVKTLQDKMAAAAAAENFELAALCRDQLRAFAAVTEKQSVVVGDVDDADVFGFSQQDGRAAIHVLTVRMGNLVAGDAFVVKTPVQTPAETLSEFLLQYYDGRSLPGEVILPFVVENQEDLRLALLGDHPDVGAVQFKTPQRGARQDLVDMATKNAAYRLTEADRQADKARMEIRILQESLRLKRLPMRMECIDISNLLGTAIVASDVCFIGGRPAKEHYRHYVINDVVGGPDDFASINEVVRRRLTRARAEGDLPDLLIIDGGQGQLTAALAARSEFPDLDFDLVSLAKSRLDKPRRKTQFIDTSAPERSFERVFSPDRDYPLALNPGTPEHRLLTQIRDEAHRFAISHHRRRRGKAATASDLEAIPGIGAVLRRKLLATFGGPDGLKKASLAELRAVKGLRDSAAVALYSFYRRLEEDAEG